MSAYSAIKAFKFADRIEGIRTGNVCAPVHLQLSISDLCNQNCHYCVHRHGDNPSLLFPDRDNRNPNRMLPYQKVIEILDDCLEMGVKAIQLTGGGEPTLHPKFNEITDAIVERGMKWALVTNGVRGRDFSTASWVRVSVDASNAETYSRVRGVAPWHFDTALHTISRWKTGVSFVVTEHNYREVYDCAELVKRVGATSFRVRPTYISALSQDILDEVREQEDHATELADKTFKVYRQMDSDLNALAQEGQPYDRCGYQYLTTWIGADQNVYRCCLTSYEPRGLLGSLRGGRFKNFWDAVAVPDFANFDARTCKACRFQPKNLALHEVCFERDEHEAFV